MTNKTTTSYSVIAKRYYTRKVYPMNNSVNRYLPKTQKHNNKPNVYFSMQKRKQVKRTKEDALNKSVPLESVALNSECHSDDIINRIDTQNLISNALSKLDDRRKKVIQMRYAIGYDREYTRPEIAKEINRSSDWVATLEATALHKMRKWI